MIAVTHIVGLDLGLEHSGAAQLTDAGHLTTWHYRSARLPDDAPIEVQVARIRTVASWSVSRVTTSTALVILEGPAYAATWGKPHERGGVWWRVAESVVRAEVPVAVLSPRTVKGYIAGNGNASKDEVQAAVAAAWPGRGLDRVTTHEADAVAMVTAGADWLGWPGPYLEGRRGAGWLRKAAWPERDRIVTAAGDRV